MDYERELERYICASERAVAAGLANIGENAAAEAMRYSVSAGGKRLRPVILLASAEAFGGVERITCALPFAASLEMLHTYSLIHDDLPAMDDDDYRRGKPSCHKRFGEANAILAGDGLLNRAYEVIIQVLSEGGAAHDASHRQAARIIADAAGINGMLAGQAMDMFYENRETDERTLVYINEKKTGALISASFKAGAVLGGAGESDVSTFARAGMSVGAAFQIRDDVLDGQGSPDKLGKPPGSDKKNNKTTYLTLLGPEECARRIDELTDEAVGLLKSTAANSEFLAWLIRRLTRRDG